MQLQAVRLTPPIPSRRAGAQVSTSLAAVLVLMGCSAPASPIDEEALVSLGASQSVVGVCDDLQTHIAAAAETLPLALEERDVARYLVELDDALTDAERQLRGQGDGFGLALHDETISKRLSVLDLRYRLASPNTFKSFQVVVLSRWGGFGFGLTEANYLQLLEDDKDAFRTTLRSLVEPRLCAS
ncbi:MAG: hypothetical protein M0R73_02885 [Dehalococcoidia bacterium]|nr:hypothetical protein [Dehalococcoidia bacterium]